MVRKILFTAVAVALLAAAPGGAQSCPTVASVGAYTITFVSAVYSPGSDETTFTYTVFNTGGQSLSHLVIGFGSLCALDLKSCSPAPCFFQDNDPTTGVTGVKFDDTQVDPGETETFVFTVAGDGTGTIETVTVATKAGPGSDTGSICGPSCPVPVELMHFSIESGAADEEAPEDGAADESAQESG